MQVYHRLHFHGRDLHHRRSIWNTISIKPRDSIIILGLGVFTGHTSDILDMESPIVFDRSTTTINIWSAHVKSTLLATRTVVTNTAEARANTKVALVPHTIAVQLRPPLHVKAEEAIDVEHNLQPTDVTNHFSGQPFTLLGADLWTCYGISSQTSSKFFTFSSVGDRRRGRCCLNEGQLPYLLFWPSAALPTA